MAVTRAILGLLTIMGMIAVSWGVVIFLAYAIFRGTVFLASLSIFPG
jgi:hypothetical protein